MNMYQHSAFKHASQAQMACLVELGIKTEGYVSAAKADRLIKENEEKWALLPPTGKQQRILEFHNAWQRGMTRGRATELIALIQECEAREKRSPPAINTIQPKASSGSLA